MTSLILNGVGEIDLIVIFAFSVGLGLLFIGFFRWRLVVAHRRAQVPGQGPSWSAAAPPALAARLGVVGRGQRSDRNVPGRLAWMSGAFVWYPTTARLASGYLEVLRWDSSWRPALGRPWFLRIIGGGRLTLSRPGDEDAILWIMNARDFTRVTTTPAA